MARAGVAAGADGLQIEVHPIPDQAWSDGAQSLYPEQFERLMGELRVIAPVIGRSLPLPNRRRRRRAECPSRLVAGKPGRGR